jgi:CHAD domain-containing protein
VRGTVDAEPIRARVRQQLEEIRANDPGTRLGTDPERLHDFRVAVRRLRALLRTIRPLIDATQTEPLRDELRWLGGLLGDVRDLDVMLDHLRGELAAIGLPEELVGGEALGELEVERERKRAALLEALDSERYAALLDALERTAETLTIEKKAQTEKLAASEFRKLRRAVEAAGPAPSDPVLHELRKRGKKARYAAELVDTKPAAKFVAAAKELQDVLGEHHDAIVAAERLRALNTDGTRDVAFVLGRLVERERQRAERTRADWPEPWRQTLRTGRAAWT